MDCSIGERFPAQLKLGLELVWEWLVKLKPVNDNPKINEKTVL